jgi:hypothetical protein
MRVPTIRRVPVQSEAAGGAWGNGTASRDARSEGQQWMLIKGRDDEHELFFYVDSVCNAWFAFEVLVRFVSSPNRLSFSRSPLNLLDMVATMSFYADLLLSYLGAGRLWSSSSDEI